MVRLGEARRSEAQQGKAKNLTGEKDERISTISRSTTDG